MPALANPPNTIHLVGKLVWLDLETTDLPGAKHFYGDLIGAHGATSTILEDPTGAVFGVSGYERYTCEGS